MERIQKAIAKARATRDEPHLEGQEAAGDDAPQHAPLPPAAPDVGAAWAELTPLEVNRAKLQKQRIMTLRGSQEATAFDVMRTKTLQTMRANNWRRLAITSPSPACGKSTIVLNMAFSMSRQADVRTVVGELDLRRPTLGKMLDAKPERGIDEVLRGRVPFAKQALCYQENLAFSLSTGSVSQAAELLHGAETPATLAEIEARYAPDVMIFDMPPMLVNDDMMAFAGQVDCVLMIAAAEVTTIKEIDACERELASQTNVMGVVLNKCRYMDGEYGYTYYR